MMPLVIMADSPALKIELENTFKKNGEYFKGIHIAIVDYDPENVNSGMVFIGRQHTVLNWRALNASRLSISYDAIEGSPWADFCLIAINSIYDISIFSMAIIYAYLYADSVQPKEAMANLKSMLGKYYSMTGDFTAHADPEWKDSATPGETVYHMIETIKKHALYGTLGNY